MKYLHILCLLVTCTVFSQSENELILKTKLNSVTIYVQNGLLSREGSITVPKGKSTVKITSLSPFIDDKSIQVKGLGDFTILSVNQTTNYLDRPKWDIRNDSLNSVLSDIELQISRNKAHLEVLAEKESVLNANKNLGGSNSGASLSQIKQALDFYDQELSIIKEDEIKTNINLLALEKKKFDIESEISNSISTDKLPTSEIIIKVDAENRTEADFIITYLVGNVGWYPKYDLRVSDINHPLNLRYKAEIFQNTGVDWNNVKIKLSNGNPNQSGVAPELKTWFLNFPRYTVVNRSNYNGITNVGSVSGIVTDENGQPLPGANIIVEGSTIGTIADLDGKYSLTLPSEAKSLVFSYIGYLTQNVTITSPTINVQLTEASQALDEVVVTAMGYENGSGRGRSSDIQNVKKEAKRMTTTTVENQTTVEFEVDEPYTIKTNGEKLVVNLKDIDIDTQYEYYGVPKIDKDAFLIARITNWDQHNLLEGEANLYFEDTYVGRSILDARSMSDTLDISLGRDKSIVLGRTKVDEFSKRRTIGTNKVDSRGFKIIARNKKTQPIKLTLFDQIPVSANSEISISAEELSNGKLDEKTGIITWELILKPQEQSDLILNYEVKYPKREKVNLEN